MARHEHLPIYKEAYDLALYFEKAVRSFSRYDKYTLGADLRNLSREILRLIQRANFSDRQTERRVAGFTAFARKAGIAHALWRARVSLIMVRA